jgi:hypothetical protein
MLTILELAFTGVGLYALIMGKIPKGFFRTMFGPGEYNLTPGKVRLWGLFLASPFPVVLPISVLILVLFPDGGKMAAIIFEFVWLLFVGIASIIIAKKIRNQETPLSFS